MYTQTLVTGDMQAISPGIQYAILYRSVEAVDFESITYKETTTMTIVRHLITQAQSSNLQR